MVETDAWMPDLTRTAGGCVGFDCLSVTVSLLFLLTTHHGLKFRCNLERVLLPQCMTSLPAVHRLHTSRLGVKKEKIWTRRFRLGPIQ